MTTDPNTLAREFAEKLFSDSGDRKIAIIGHVYGYAAGVAESAARIAELESALRKAADELSDASQDVADWGSYAGEYFQKKHRWSEDIQRYIAAENLARAALKETP